MSEAELIAELNAGYQCPVEAGAAWREACNLGLDMSLVEANLDMTDWKRFQQNDRALALALAIQGQKDPE
jgi:hypothetical protein